MYGYLRVENSNQLSVFYNGNKIGTYTTEYDFAPAEWSSSIRLGNGFSGSANEFRVYNTALTDSEISNF